MKAAGIILIILCLAAFIGMGVLYFQANLTVAAVECYATDALNQEETFNRLKEEAAAGTFTGTLFGSLEAAEAKDCQFYTYVLRAENRAFLKAEVLEIQITPMSGDLLQMGAEGPVDLASGKVTELSATILTGKDARNVREATVSWYFWGIPFSTKVTCK